MSHTVIAVEAVSKLYRLGTISSGTLSHDLNRWWARLRGRPDPLLKIGQEERSRRENGYVWALKDVSFAVEQGEVLGIIGRNGAGKSTLLKILSRVTAPTSGQIKVKGRIASLLEVGTGFHPELTGRENIFMNGAILGMTRAEIRRKFDEIVAFAEIEPFIDTPVKRYSSGMYVRLAFAVAAHLEPEILLVDEVLAVGDVAFQKKCLGKMGEVAKEGRTVLFVSHNMAAISRICQRALLVELGKIAEDLEASAAVHRYLGMTASGNGAYVDLRDYNDRSGDGTARIIEARIRDTAGNPANCFSVGDSIVFEFEVQYKIESASYSHSIQIVNSDGIPIYHVWDMDSRSAELPPVQQRLVRVTIPNVELFPDQYYVNLWVGHIRGTRSDYVNRGISFTIDRGNPHIKQKLDKSKGLVFKAGIWSYTTELVQS
jgi:lipopolysaccharide transport system ATP-binding protein